MMVRDHGKRWSGIMVEDSQGSWQKIVRDHGRRWSGTMVEDGQGPW